MIYFLLLERKRRRPALEDDDEAVRPRNSVSGEVTDPPKKRLDTCRLNGQNCMNFGQISEGSPITTRRQAFKYEFFFFLPCFVQSFNRFVFVLVSDLIVIHVIIAGDHQRHPHDQHHIIAQPEIQRNKV